MVEDDGSVTCDGSSEIPEGQVRLRQPGAAGVELGRVRPPRDEGTWIAGGTSKPLSANMVREVVGGTRKKQTHAGTERTRIF